MLYLNTRSKIDTYTANMILRQELPEEAGLTLPLNVPVLDEEMLKTVASMSFADAVCHVLNIFFPGKITSWDISCALGRSPVRVDAISQKVLMGVLWDNRSKSAAHWINALYSKLTDDASTIPTRWARIAISVAFLFGLFTDSKLQQLDSVDFACAAGDMETVFAAWYARKMGLKIGTILCVCNENSNIWDFLHRGSLNTAAAAVSTALPEMDVQLPIYLESLMYCVLGREVVLQYTKTVEDAGVFALMEEQLVMLNEGMYASVVGSSRVGDVIVSVSKTDNYSLDSYAAAVYGGIQDYRAKTGKNNYTLVWAKFSP